MSDRFSPSERVFRSPLALLLSAETPALARALEQFLASDRYTLTTIPASELSEDKIESLKDRIDCLIVERCSPLLVWIESLSNRGIWLPVVWLETDETRNSVTYHSAEVCHSAVTFNDLPQAIDRAIAQFLKLIPTREAPPPEGKASPPLALREQQRRLSEKLQERLDYLGLYYKRNPEDFWANLSPAEQQEVGKALTREYREILLHYFDDAPDLNEIIDRFVTQAFFADLSIARVLEIHMDLIEEFSQQLKIEGRSEEILLDYRLTLIDIIAHLCEMYRRSIPREDVLIEPSSLE